MNYHHLTIEERSCIRKYYVDGLSYREIARLIGRNVSTVSREIRRNCTHMYDIPTYYPHTAQKKYLLRRSYCHRGMFRSQEVIEYINEKLRATWSPEQIACTPCELEDYLPLDLRKIPGKRKPESAAPQGKEPREQGNARKIQQGQVDSLTGQIRVQPKRSRALGSGYGCKRPGQEQSLLRYPGRTQDALLHCREDA